MNVTIAIVALGFACGALLVVSPALWPRDTRGVDAGHEHPLASPLRGDLPVVDGFRSRRSRLRGLLDDAGFAHVSTVSFLALSALASVVVGSLVFLFSPVWVLAVCAGLVAAIVPTVLLVGRRTRRASERDGMWPDVADTLVSHIRAGRSIVEAVADLGDSFSGSIGESARRFALRTAVSGNVTECLRALKAEWADAAGDRIVEVLIVTRDVGGTRLTSVLRELSRNLRRDLAVRREVMARQSWIRVAAGIGAAAPWVVVALLSLRSEAVEAYRSSAGALLIFGGLGLSIAAYQVMIRIGRLRPERRWFA